MLNEHSLQPLEFRTKVAVERIRGRMTEGGTYDRLLHFTAL